MSTQDLEKITLKLRLWTFIAIIGGTITMSGVWYSHLNTENIHYTNHEDRISELEHKKILSDNARANEITHIKVKQP
jgi:hypothetical protein